MNTPLTFELAKLLKEKEFDKITESLWHFNGSECIKMPNKNSENFGFSAPTIAEVVMWLYKKYGIWISVWQGRSSENFGYRIQGKESFYEVNYFRLTPTEAYEAAIEYTLNNLL